MWRRAGGSPVLDLRGRNVSHGDLQLTLGDPAAEAPGPEDVGAHSATGGCRSLRAASWNNLVSHGSFTLLCWSTRETAKDETYGLQILELSHCMGQETGTVTTITTLCRILLRVIVVWILTRVNLLWDCFSKLVPCVSHLSNIWERPCRECHIKACQTLWHACNAQRIGIYLVRYLVGSVGPLPFTKW